MKNKKRFTTLSLAFAMLLSLAACGKQNVDSTQQSQNTFSESAATSSTGNAEASSNELDWLNTTGGLPIVKEGTEKTLSIYVLQTIDHGAPEESWLYRYLTEEMNINLEFTTFTSENQAEFLSLAFVGDSLPDIIIGGNFSTTDLMKYGVNEGQLLDLAPYINDTYMPNLTSLYTEHPSYRSYVTDTNGHVWSLGYISNDKERGRIDRAFLNYDWLEECGLPVPTTLDDFIETMRIFKEKGLCDYPIGGSFALENPGQYIMNALGYVGNDANGNSICLRDGEVVYPAADCERFGDFLKVMNQLYTEGLIHPDFYTMDSSTTKAFIAEGTGFISQAPFVYVSDYDQYWGAVPLTSQWNDTAQWPNSSWALSSGAAVVTSACDEPELAAKFLDFFYDSDNYDRSIEGPLSSETDILYDMVSGREIKEDGSILYPDIEANPDAYANTNDYLFKHVGIWQAGSIGYAGFTFDQPANGYPGEPDLTQYKDPSVLRKELPNGEKAFRIGLQTTLSNYVNVERYPTVYFDADIGTELDNLKTTMWEYAQQEIAKFVTGTRPLTDKELEDYFDTLDDLGAQEYVKVYADYYESIQ